MINKIPQKDPQWFVTMIKIICTLFYTPLIILFLWVIYLYITDDIRKLYHVD
jgi:hypothetical protein